MRRLSTLFTCLLLALAMSMGGALAMEPPADPAKGNFGCVDGSPNPILGHPGAVGDDGGIAHATGLVAERKAGFVGKTPDHSAEQSGARPTAWAAVDNAGPIDLGGC